MGRGMAGVMGWGRRDGGRESAHLARWTGSRRHRRWQDTGMPNAIAFFPWVALDEPVIVGPVRLLPYERGSLPGDQPNVSQGEIDTVLAAYAERKDHLIPEAMLMEIADWALGEEMTDQVKERLFRARELVAFAALAKRRLFRGHFDYCNFDTYAFVIQNYQAGDVGGFSFFTRRRDGGTNYVWDAEEFAFLKPLHVASNSKVALDLALLDALFKADERDVVPFEAIVEFGRANTDSSDVPTHTELVMVKSAFEFLFTIGTDASEFAKALAASVPPSKTYDGPLASRWTKARPNAARPLEAWAREFCDIRGGAAHGKKRGGPRFVWSEHAHLAFASVLFPLLVKQQLSRSGFLVLDERDSIELEWIEAYLMHDPFEPDNEGRRHQPRAHPWSSVYSSQVVGEALRRHIARSIDEASSCDVSTDE